MTLRETLSAEHDELDRLAERMLTIVTGDAPTDDLSSTRWRLNHVLAIHLAKEDGFLYPDLARSHSASVRSLAQRFATEMGGMSATYRAYCARWTLQALNADWSGFCNDTRKVMMLLRRRIQREELELYRRIDAAA